MAIPTELVPKVQGAACRQVIGNIDGKQPQGQPPGLIRPIHSYEEKQKSHSAKPLYGC